MVAPSFAEIGLHKDLFGESKQMFCTSTYLIAIITIEFHVISYFCPFSANYSCQNFFAELEDRKSEFGIADLQLGLTTLEEVFLNIAKQAELESAAAEGRFTTLSLPSGTSVQVRELVN